MHTKNFNLKHTLESGQFFRYYTKNSWYYITFKEYFFRARQENDDLTIDGVPERIAKQFFGLEQDYDNILATFEDPLLKTIIKQLIGLRLLQQDPWECMCAFICSSASNIPKITKNVNLLAQNFGKHLTFENEESYSFPRPGELTDNQKILTTGVGFRAKFLININKTVSEQQINLLKTNNYHQTIEYLTSLNGIGEKIADCVALFSLQKFQAFPVDVWIQRIMEQHYTGSAKKQQIKIPTALEGQGITDNDIGIFNVANTIRQNTNCKPDRGKVTGYSQQIKNSSQGKPLELFKPGIESFTNHGKPHSMHSIREIKNFAQIYFGKYAGYAQQFLYHWGRMEAKKSKI